MHGDKEEATQAYVILRQGADDEVNTADGLLAKP
jgi:hypothetical protein